VLLTEQLSDNVRQWLKKIWRVNMACTTFIINVIPMVPGVYKAVTWIGVMKSNSINSNVKEKSYVSN
jgi:uncharacterized membrane protein YjjB (DUF3815 family)